ncbi:MAG: hypothetical protein ABI305_09255 [Tepidiformaceae bacterium]
MTIKATSALSILAIWVTMIAAVIAQPDQWWSLFFAFFATAAVGVSAWRRIGLARLLAISGTWFGTALAVGFSGAGWVAVFAFVSTGAIVYSVMRRDGLLIGAGIAAVWLFSGIVIANNADGAWICVFAFLTTAALANTRGNDSRGVSAILWWGIACAVMIAAGGGWTFVLAIAAFLLTTASLGFGDFGFPRRLEWDLFDRDDDSDVVR